MPSLGVNLRVTGHCNQGGRKYMEDVFSVAYQQTEDEKDLEYAFFGIFDGHGGREAAQFAKDNLMEFITNNNKFWSDDDTTVLRAIREGFLETQKAMWRELANWRKTASGLPSTAGTTASICFVKRGKIFIGHVGDSGIMLGERDPHHPTKWRAKRLTRDHKPECEPELSRIQEAGGKVVSKSGVPRVVWYRPSGGHQGPVRRSTHIDEVPFLAVARALGDLWSYNAKDDVYVVSPDPDLHVYDINILKDRCLVLATDGAWNVISPDMAVQSVYESETNNELHMINPKGGHTWINPSKKLVDLAIDRWNTCSLRADNTSAVTVMLDPPGPPRAQVLRQRHSSIPPAVAPPPVLPKPTDPVIRTKSTEPKMPCSGADNAKSIAIISRYPNSTNVGEKTGVNLVGSKEVGNPSRVVQDSSSPNQTLKLTTAPPPVTATKTPAAPLQCNQVTSSDDDDEEEDDNAPPPVPKRPLATKASRLASSEGPASRTRNQSGSGCPPANAHAPSAAQRALATGQRGPAGESPAANKRQAVAATDAKDNDSDAENKPSARQNGQVSTPNVMTGKSRPLRSASKVAAKTPELSPRVLRPRNTPAASQAAGGPNTPLSKRKRRSFEPANVAAKVLKTANNGGRTPTSAVLRSQNSAKPVRGK